MTLAVVTVRCSPDDDGFLLSFDDPNDVLDDVGGAHDDVALDDGFGAFALDGEAPWSS